MSARWAALAADPLTRVIVAIGITQIIGWGTTVYALGVLAQPIAASQGWSFGVVFGGLTVALLASGVVSLPVGRWIDRQGGRWVMCSGSLLAAASLALLSAMQSLVVYFIAWALIGVAMRMVLYDAAFVSLVQLAPARGRWAISLVTLFGGLASSLLWPIGAALETAYGWRVTLLVYAALNLCVCLPLHAIFLTPLRQPFEPAPTAAADVAHTTAAPPVLTDRQRRRAMWQFSLTMAASGLVTGAIAVQMVSVLSATGIAPQTAVALASVQGVSQTLARLLDLVFGRRMHAVTLGRITLALVATALVVLAVGGTGWVVAVVFVVVFGAANGLATIVRGTVPLALFGARGFGEMLGRLSIPIVVMNAAAPALLAILVQTFGSGPAMGVLAVIAVLAWVSMESLAAWYGRVRG